MRRMTQTAKDTLRQVANVVIIPCAILFNVIPRSGVDSVAKVSRDTQPMLAAAGWTFAVWGILFLGQLAYALFQVTPSMRTSSTLRRIGVWTALAVLGEGIWTALFTAHLFAAAWVTIVTILACQLVIQLRMGDAMRHGRELWLVRLPFELTFGWITVATLLDSAQLVATLDWAGTPSAALFWSELLVVLGAAAAVTVALVRRSPAFAVIVAWGLAGIAWEKHLDVPILGWTAAAASLGLVVLVAAEAAALAGGRMSDRIHRA